MAEMPTQMTDRQQQILAFEKTRWNHTGAKDTAILELFGCTATRYYAELNALIDRPEAYEAEPMLVKRLRRLRDERRARRTAPARR